MHKNIKLLTWFNFFTDFKLYAPIAILYFAQVTGSFALGMSIFSITTISSAIFEIPTGVYSDFIGKRKAIIFGAISAVIYSLFYAIGQSYLILFIGSIFNGLSQAFYSGNNDALVYDTLYEIKKEKEFSEILGKVNSAFQIALAISALLGGFIGNYSFSAVMWISVLGQLACLFISFFIKEPKVHYKKSGNIYLHLNEAFKNFIQNRKIRLLSISSMIVFGIGEAVYQFQAAFYKLLWPIWAIGIAKTLSNIGAYLSYRFSGKIIKKFKAVRILLSSNIYSRIINIFSVIYPTILSPLLMTTTSLWHGVAQISKSSLLQEEFTDRQRATMGSLDSLLGSVFYGIVAVLLGFVADKLSPTKAILVSQIALLPTVWLYWKLFKTEKV